MCIKFLDHPFPFEDCRLLLPSEEPEIVCTVDDSEDTLLGETGVVSTVHEGVPGVVGGKTVTAGITEYDGSLLP